MNKPLVPIFFGFDERFAKFASVAMLSLIEHTDPKRNYRIHVLHTDLTKETIDKINEIEAGAKDTLFKGEDLYLLDTIDVGQYSAGSPDLKRWFIAAQLG